MPDPRIWPVEKSEDWSQIVSGVSSIVVPANARRVDCDITNVCGHWIYLSRSDPAELLAGHPLAPWGGSYHIGTDNLWKGDVWAIITDKQDEGVLAISEGSDPG